MALLNYVVTFSPHSMYYSYTLMTGLLEPRLWDGLVRREDSSTKCILTLNFDLGIMQRKNRKHEIK